MDIEYHLNGGPSNLYEHPSRTQRPDQLVKVSVLCNSALGGRKGPCSIPGSRAPLSLPPHIDGAAPRPLGQKKKKNIQVILMDIESIIYSYMFQ